eukprot:756709-Hanusia_phi.AAC.7
MSWHSESTRTTVGSDRNFAGTDARCSTTRDPCHLQQLDWTTSNDNRFSKPRSIISLSRIFNTYNCVAQLLLLATKMNNLVSELGGGTSDLEGGGIDGLPVKEGVDDGLLGDDHLVDDAREADHGSAAVDDLGELVLGTVGRVAAGKTGEKTRQREGRGNEG